MKNLQKTKQLGQEQEVGVNDPASLSELLGPITLCCGMTFILQYSLC